MDPEDQPQPDDESPTEPAGDGDPPTHSTGDGEASDLARGQAVGPPTSPTGDGEALTPARGHRLQKVLAQVGFGSRRVCDDLIADGLVTVNGEVAELGRRVDPEVDRVEVDGIPVGIRPGLVHYLLNKPAGVVTTAADTHGRPTVVELVPAEPRVFPVGRLDLDTEGLLLLTNDGDLAHRVTHPSHGVEKEYLAEVASPPSRAALRQLREGVDLDDGPTAPARVALVAPTLVRLTIHEGRNRQVRRMLDAVGHPVVRLIRTRIGPVSDRRLAPGEWRLLTTEEVRALETAVAEAGTAGPDGPGTGSAGAGRGR
jgi:23S rRNA pseudouridine2605 synthase